MPYLDYGIIALFSIPMLTALGFELGEYLADYVKVGRNGGLTFYRIGRFGGSFYWSKARVQS